MVDTSALMAILLHEPEAASCATALETADRILISAATLVETMIVAGRRGLGAAARDLVESVGALVEPVSEARAKGAVRAHDRWGRGVHPAGLNFGDCIAYDLATHNDCPLLYVGSDFALTDVRAAV